MAKESELDLGAYHQLPANEPPIAKKVDPVLLEQFPHMTRQDYDSVIEDVDLGDGTFSAEEYFKIRSAGKNVRFVNYNTTQFPELKQVIDEIVSITLRIQLRRYGDRHTSPEPPLQKFKAYVVGSATDYRLTDRAKLQDIGVVFVMRQIWPRVVNDMLMVKHERQ